MKKIKKSNWLPCLIALYFIGMALFYAPELIKTGQTMRLITVSVLEIIILIVLHIFLKKRERIGKIK